MPNTTATGVIDFDLLDHAELVQYARLFYNEILQNQMQLGQYFPDRTVDDLQFSLPRGGFQDVDAAEYRAWDVPAPMTGRQGIARVKGEIAPISRGIPLTEEEGLRLRSLERGDDGPIIRQIYADVERMLRSVAIRIELARGDVLVDGKVTLAENGLQLEADYEVPVGNFTTVAVAWTVANAATAVPVTNLLDIIESDLAPVGADPSNYVLLMSRTKLPALQLNNQMRAFAASGGTTPQRINLATIQDIFTDEGLPLIAFYDSVFRVDGVQVRPIPANRAILLPRPGAGDAMGATLFGPTAEAVLMAERGVIEARQAPGLIAVVLESQHPVQTTTVAAATALPVLLNPELLFPINIG